MIPWSPVCIDRRSMIGMIYKENYYTSLHTKYKGSWFKRRYEFLFTLKIYKLIINNPWDGAIVDPQVHDWQDLCKAPHNIAVN